MRMSCKGKDAIMVAVFFFFYGIGTQKLALRETNCLDKKKIYTELDNIQAYVRQTVYITASVDHVICIESGMDEFFSEAFICIRGVVLRCLAGKTHADRK